MIFNQRIRRLLAVMLGLFLASVGKAQAAPIAVPGTSVSLNPPAGFALATNFSGLENLQSGSSITITELPADAYEEISALFRQAEFSTEAFLRQGITVESYGFVSVDGSQVPLLQGTQPSSGGEVTKYMTLFRGENTVLVTFNIIDPGQDTTGMVESTIASISLASAPTLEEKLSQLSFQFQVAPPFRVADVLAGSSALMTVVDGPDPSGLSPVVIIARGQNVVRTREIAQLSEQLLRGTQGFSLATIVTAEAVEFAGGSGYRIEATVEQATDLISLVQYVYVPENGRYIRLLATGDYQIFSEVQSAVAAIARSVSLNESLKN